MTKWRRIWSERFPRVPLDVVEVPVAQQREALDSALVDVCFVRLPIEPEGLHTIRLYDEVPVVVVPKDHVVAAFDEVSLADLAGEKLQWGDTTTDAIDQVAWGAGLLCVPQSVARSHSRRDLVYRPITDSPPTTIALAWAVQDSNELIEEFIGIVRGRTVNSSRTAQARSLTPPADPRATPNKAAPKDRPRRTGGVQRAGRRKR